MANIIERDNETTLERIPEARPMQGPVPAAMHGFAPAERVVGAQPVAVHRDEGELLKKLKVLAAAAGEDWYYRFPVRKKVRNEKTGRDEYVTDSIEGPSIKCANNVARLYGNCDVDSRVFDFGDSYMFYGRFTDLETGFSLTRPYRQRKSQSTMRTKDPQRAEDIVFQIGASKAIRNVICNALEFFTAFAAEEAKKSIIETVGKKLGFYRDKVAQRLSEMHIDLKAVETVRGRAFKDWLAPDVARTIAELQAIQDGMATIGETYLGETPDDDAASGETTEPKSVGGTLDKFAQAPTGTSDAPQQTAAPDAAAAAVAELLDKAAKKPPINAAAFKVLFDELIGIVKTAGGEHGATMIEDFWAGNLARTLRNKAGLVKDETDRFTAEVNAAAVSLRQTKA
jgi:hypothetical protein